MSGDRSEAPTPRRIVEARRRGQVAVSRELTGAAALAAGAGVVALQWPGAFGVLSSALRRSLADAPTAGASFDPAVAQAALLDAVGEVLRMTALPAVAAGLAGGAAGLLQTRGLVAPGLAAPRPDRLHPGSGLRRLLGRDQLAATALSLAKLAPAALLAGHWLRSSWGALAALPRAGMPTTRWIALLAPLAGRLLLLLSVLGALDHLLSHRRHRRALAMTRDEVRREVRDEEGDPGHRAERRRRHRALAEAGPVAAATCVLVNPTRLAVALRHVRGQGAPKVVAKGRGAAARRIRSAARLAGVPIVREVALARALHREVEVGEEIPEALYDAAAAVLAHLAGGIGAPPAPAEGAAPGGSP